MHKEYAVYHLLKESEFFNMLQKAKNSSKINRKIDKMAIPMTKAGHSKLEEELKDLKTIQRPAIIEAIAAAREHGDISENAEYHAAREKQAWIEGRINEIKNTLADANIIDISNIRGNTVMFGATVTIVNEETNEESEYQIVGEVEADLSKRLLSNTSPIGRALIGKEVGESFTVTTPAGEKYFEILNLRYNGRDLELKHILKSSDI